ncbi:MAG: hypothetical protein JWO03_16 [Bacteroidetes bacterium]|nr:hypothetical protein [Bacteroidota bacterium]
MKRTLLILLSISCLSPAIGQNVTYNKKEDTASLTQSLIKQLDTIYHDDQDGRVMADSLAKIYGWQAKVISDLGDVMSIKDSINRVKVCGIIDKCGWLGKDIIGQNGNTTLFLVIQHADLSVQKKYLPVLREAVKKGSARGSDLALMEDRMALRTGRKQIYGSQISMYEGDSFYCVCPLEDPDNVDKRRAAVGLRPMSVYLSYWQTRWDVVQYKKDLPTIVAKEKKLNDKTEKK